MKTDNSITVNDFCVYHNVEQTFVSYLHEEGIITIETSSNNSVIPADDILKLEKLARLHTQLQINLPGLAAINNLLQQMEDMRQQMNHLRGRLSIYEH